MGQPVLEVMAVLSIAACWAVIFFFLTVRIVGRTLAPRILGSWRPYLLSTMEHLGANLTNNIVHIGTHEVRISYIHFEFRDGRIAQMKFCTRDPDIYMESSDLFVKYEHISHLASDQLIYLFGLRNIVDSGIQNYTVSYGGRVEDSVIDFMWKDDIYVTALCDVYLTPWTYDLRVNRITIEENADGKTFFREGTIERGGEFVDSINDVLVTGYSKSVENDYVQISSSII